LSFKCSLYACHAALQLAFNLITFALKCDYSSYILHRVFSRKNFSNLHHSLAWFMLSRFTLIIAPSNNRKNTKISYIKCKQKYKFSWNMLNLCKCENLSRGVSDNMNGNPCGSLEEFYNLLFYDWNMKIHFIELEFFLCYLFVASLKGLLCLSKWNVFKRIDTFYYRAFRSPAISICCPSTKGELEEKKAFSPKINAMW
jgi:hypothetical protein